MAARDDYQQGMALHRQGRLDAAVEAYGRALAAEPAFAEALNALGIARQQQGDLESAIASYRAALAAKPDYTSACSNLGAALLCRGDLDGALEWGERAIHLQPDHADAHYNLGQVLHQRGEIEAAAAAYTRASDLDPGHASAWNNLGIALRDLGRPGEAVAAYARALGLRPDAAEIRYNQAMALLEDGDFARGWPAYDARFASGDVPARRFVQPRWRGEDISTRTLLVWAEQGFGDTIQFVRCLHSLTGRAGRVVFEVQPALARLTEGVAGADQVVAAGQPLPPFDVQIPLLALPDLLGIRLETIPSGIPYLHPDPDLAETWRRRLGRGGRLKVGLTWAGNPQQKNNLNRSMPAAALAGLLRLPAAFFSLQPGEACRDLLRQGIGEVTDLGPELTDFAETAAALAALDLIVTVDTSVAHLAGALGRPTWTMLAFAPDWRWLRDREDCPWYPTMRLFRQQRRRDWAPVMARIEAELRRLV